MRQALIVLVAAGTVAGCAATKQETADVLSSRYVGKSIDALVTEFGPPANNFRMNSGGSAYMWQLSNETNMAGGDGWATAKTSYCRVSVIASSAGVVTQLKTEDISGTGGVMGAMGIDIYGSLCARRLGIPRQT